MVQQGGGRSDARTARRQRHGRALASIERRAGWAIATVALECAYELALVAYGLSGAGELGPQAAPPAAHLARSALVVAAAACFLRWLHAAVAHAHEQALGLGVLFIRPRSAVVSFFLPIVNVWRPYDAVNQLSRAANPLAFSEPEPEPEPEPDETPPGDDRSPSRARRPERVRWSSNAPVLAWWLTLLASCLFSCTGFWSRDPLELTIAAALHAVAGALLVAVVRSITLRLREIGRRRSAPLGPAPFYR